jgi:N12 class adenine-specific DNA methylase
VNLAEHRNTDGAAFQINEYFAPNPHMMLGTMANESSMYRANEPTLMPDDRDLGAALSEAIATLPQGIYRAQERTALAQSGNAEVILAPDYVKENAFVLHDGAIAVRTGATLTPLPKLADETARRIRGLIKVRDAVRNVLRTQLDEHSDEAILGARRELNLRYDLFAARFGAVNDNANRRAFRADPDYPLLCSLEDYNDETKKAVKTAIFRERTIHQPRTALMAETPQDALVLTLNETGRVDLPRMEMLLRKPPEEFLPELKGLIYLNPQTEQWETDDQYLSGDVRVKLENAKAAAAANPAYHENVTALEAVQPVDLTPSEIEARLGAVWIPPADVEAFAKSLLGAEGITVSHAAAVGTWFIKADYNARGTVANTTEWGTTRYSAVELIQDALNLKTPTVHDTDPKTDAPVVNVQQTEAARDKMEKIKERFRTWIWEDDERRERLCRKYNDDFNSVRLRVFNGSHLTLPSSSQQIVLRPHQKNGVWRIVQSDNTLLAHAVGAGKTYTMVAAGIELKRLGLASKPMFVVPNHMLGQFSAELLMLYPTANILVAGKEDFAVAKRARLFSRIATGNWDGVIVTHSSFEKIPLSVETRREFIEDQIYEIKQAIREQRSERGTRLVKELERIEKRLTAKLEGLSADHKKDNTLTFEELGIDRLFIDEAHKFKNLFYVTKMTRVAGLPQTASERAFDMFLKVQHIQSRNKGGGVVFATGTPISNTMAEMFTMLRYLQMSALRRNQLQHFDSWAGTFGETVTSMELSPDGSGYRLRSRFARFVNVPELMQQFRQAADVQTAEMLKLPVPKLDQGRPITVSAPTSPELKKYVEHLIKRVEAIKSGDVEPWEDNMLNVTTDGRKAALDLRLVLPRVRDNPDSKTNQAVERIHQIWLDSAETKGAQLVFCDLSTPKAGGKGFSVYDDVREKLIARGVVADQIAFIQDFDDDTSKASLFKNVREGKVRVLLGSTAKMGEGTNVQKRLVALHHLDAPWRPADIEQREGRILRQGNENEYVKIFRYVTEGSFDAYMWQTLETKCRFIAQVMNGDATVRRAEDVDSAALPYAEVKAIASGNPLVIEKAQVDAEVMRLTRLKKQHAESLYQMRSRIRSLAGNVESCERDIANVREDLRTRTSTRGDNFLMTVQKETFTDRVKAGRALVFMAAALKPFQATKTIGSVGGFPITLSKFDERANLIIHGKGEYKANVSDSPAGTIASVEHALDGMADRLRERESDLQQYRKQAEDLTKQLDHPFEHEEKLTVATKRQQEIITALDITKNQASAKLDEGPEQLTESVEETLQQTARKKHAKTTSVAV